MTKSEVENMFGVKEGICLSNGAFVLVDDFLNIAGFKDCDATKQDMLVFDNGTKGYTDLINTIPLSE